MVRSQLLAAILLCSPFLSPPAARCAITVQIGQNFTASTLFVDIFETPPDSDGAIGPNHFVQFINGRFSVFDKANGTKVLDLTDAAFWNNAGVSTAGFNISDPRIIYDPLSQRWFAAQIDFNASSLRNNRFLVAVSVTQDPTGVWKGVAFQADPGGNFADFPSLGLDANGVYLGANMFDSSENLLGVLLTSIPKADLLQATPTAIRRTTSGLMSIGSRGFSLQPAINFSRTHAAEPVLAVENDGTDFLTHTILKSFLVVGATNAGATFTTNTDIPVPAYNVPLDPPQPNGRSNLADGDLRMGASVYQVGDILYAVHGTQLNSRAAIRWYKIRAGDFSVLQSGTISDTNLHLFYPSIAANASGYAVIGFNGCSANTFVSSYAVAGETINGTTSFGSLILLKAGVANYERLSSGESRWGDYSTTSVDPVIPNHFWTIQEYVSSANIWSTQVTELQICPDLSSLQIALAGTNVIVAWPTNAAGYTLQTATNLLPGAFWSPVTNPITMCGQQNTITVSPSEPARFYRLTQ